jgi:hypothetical protein
LNTKTHACYVMYTLYLLAKMLLKIIKLATLRNSFDNQYYKVGLDTFLTGSKTFAKDGFEFLSGHISNDNHW